MPDVAHGEQSYGSPVLLWPRAVNGSLDTAGPLFGRSTGLPNAFPSRPSSAETRTRVLDSTWIASGPASVYFPCHRRSSFLVDAFSKNSSTFSPSRNFGTPPTARPVFPTIPPSRVNFRVAPAVPLKVPSTSRLTSVTLPLPVRRGSTSL